MERTLGNNLFSDKSSFYYVYFLSIYYNLYYEQIRMCSNTQQCWSKK